METTFLRSQIAPLMNAAILALPKSKDRAVKGSELLATGKVQRLADAPAGVDRWLVYGSSSEPYSVSLANDTCDCPDRAATCKHKYAARYALALGVLAPVEIAPTADTASDATDATLWQMEENPTAILDAEIQTKLDELSAAGLDADADLLVIGDWIWAVGDVDPDTADALGLRWHARREVHYWRPVWAAMDPEGYNDKKDLAGLAEKYGLKCRRPRRRVEDRTPQELAMLLVPKLKRDEDGDLWA